MNTVDLILKLSKGMCSLFRQVDEQGSDSDIPATCAVTVADEALPEGSHPDGRAYLFRKKIPKRVMKAPV